jgi:hypothetical protein
MDFKTFAEENEFVQLLGGNDVITLLEKPTFIRSAREVIEQADTTSNEIGKKLENARVQLENFNRLFKMMTDEAPPVKIDLKYKKFYTEQDEVLRSRNLEKIMILKKEALKSSLSTLKDGLTNIREKIARRRTSFNKLESVLVSSRIQSGGILQQRAASTFPFESIDDAIYLNLQTSLTSGSENCGNISLLSFIPLNFIDEELMLNFEFIEETINYLNSHSLTINCRNTKTKETVLKCISPVMAPITKSTDCENLNRLKAKIYEFIAFTKLDLYLKKQQDTYRFHSAPSGFRVNLKLCV